MAIQTRDGSVKGTLYLYKRVPKLYASVEPRRFIGISLHTDSPMEAKTKEAATWGKMDAAWEAKLAGESTDAEQRSAAARDLAEARGFRYIRSDQVAKLPIKELRDRIAAIPGFKDQPDYPDMMEASAILGGAKEPPLTVSKALELYWTLAKDKALGKSEDQLRRWKNSRMKAVKTFIAVVGDKAIKDISGDDMLDFRNWWIVRLEEEDLTPNSANKDLIHRGDVLRTVNRMKRLGPVLPLTDLSFKQGEGNTRPPFSAKWITEKLLKAAALDGLHPEARAIVLTKVNTGCRPSELTALTPNTIRLDHNVHQFSIEPEGRQVKSK